MDPDQAAQLLSLADLAPVRRRSSRLSSRFEEAAVARGIDRTEGPWLAAALLCEKVIEDKEGTLSLIRIIDRVTTTAVGQGTPSEMPPTPITVTLVAAFKSGSARGRSDFRIDAEAPTGLRTPLAQALSIIFEGEDRGANLIINLNFTAQHEGLYWFDLFLDDKLVTRVPLRVVYQRQETGGPATPGPGR